MGVFQNVETFLGLRQPEQEAAQGTQGLAPTPRAPHVPRGTSASETNSCILERQGIASSDGTGSRKGESGCSYIWRRNREEPTYESMQVRAEMRSSPAATTAGSTSGQDAQDNVRAVVIESWLARHRARQGQGPAVNNLAKQPGELSAA